MTIRRVCLTIFALTMVACVDNPLRADATPAQRRQIEEMNSSVSKAGSLFLQKKYDVSGDVVRDVQKQYDELAKLNDPQVTALLETVYKRLLKAHALLELEGVSLPPLKKPADAPPKPANSPNAAISFTKHVAPILIGKCGRCHVNSTKGEFSMANYNALMKGTPEGTVVFKGDPVGSRLIVVIEEGDMPRGGLKVSADELTTLKKWINEGAKFDGENVQTALANLTDASVGDVPNVEIMQASGDETVSFANDIAPVLDQHCANCHGRGRRVSGGLDMLNFAGLLKGGDSGPPVLPKKPADSLLVKKLKGTAGGERMPLERPPLADDEIAKIETWIAEGATFDGPDAKQDIRQVANLAKAKRLTHEELSAERAANAMKNWALGMPGISADQVETENFLLIGNVGPETLKQYGQQAEAIVPKIVDLYAAPTDEPLVKGRITLFLFKQRYDYGEYGKMVEKRSLPRQWKGHWRFNIIVAYGAVIPSRSEDYSTDALLGQQIAGVYVASLGPSPHWFAEGSARVAAARIAADDSRVVQWKDGLADVLSRMSMPDDFITGKLDQESADIASYDFVNFLMTDKNRYQSVLAALRKGTDFDEAFSKAYGGSPAQLAAAWSKRAARGSRRSSR